ncbi:glucose-1-phosphate thymidylyltransferase RfbA [Myroides injenensis]|uniref:glucose-1-phosphate thymidylyltransferase RfbA n=1 Tax=Myroides injenensis TaxID=1183151 RepID=UPI0002895F93|nr:glucose-1-phosphate thymidylyltransferase RfbA [Myroides injenensis]
MKGIILAGGAGTRLHPLTLAISKQLLPVYDKPMIYYPLSILMLAGIKEILIISTPHDLPNFQKLLSDGSNLGISLEYAEQEKPEGIAQALLIGESFINKEEVCLILGDNIFYGNGLQQKLINAIDLAQNKQQAVVFGYTVKDPERYGVVEFDNNGQAISIEEKPQTPKSHFAVVGLYFFPKDASEFTKLLTPSNRGELEITSLNNIYLEEKRLSVQTLGRGFAWLDTGTHESLVEATEFVKTVEKRTGLKIACLEEIAWNQKWITKNTLSKNINNLKGEYYEYIRELIK